MQPMEEIYQKYAQMVYRYLLSLTQDSDVAEELVQETFYQAIRSSDRYNGGCAMSTWLCAIAKNVLAAYRRKHPVMENIEEQEISGISTEKDVFASVDRVELFKKIHELPEPYREIMYLRIFCGLSFREIGEVHEKTENWARVTYYRGKEKLRKEVENHE